MRLPLKIPAPLIVWPLRFKPAPRVTAPLRPIVPAKVLFPVKALFAESAMPPKLLRAVAALDAPVPPCAIDRGVVRPLKLVMSELAPEAAAPRFVRAAYALVSPVPPCATVRGNLNAACFALNVAQSVWLK